MTKSMLRGFGWVVVSLTGALACPAQTTGAQISAAPAQIRFIFENPKLQPARYVMDISEDGIGHFRSEPGSAAPPDAVGVTAQPVETDIHIEEPLRSALFKIARSHNFFNVACEASKEKVAFTGKKAFEYKGPDGHGSCTFNWSHDQQLMKASDDLIAVAYSLEVGRRLAVEHEHSRLSLDAELEGLEDAAKNGRAQQLENIAPQLESIAGDEQVMTRARQRARELLGKNGKAA